MPKITSILKDLESGPVYSNDYSTIFCGDAQTQLNDILQWVHANLIPTLLYETRYLDTDKIPDIIKVAASLKNAFSKIITDLERQKLARCNNCKESSCSCNIRNFTYWKDLQDQFVLNGFQLGSTQKSSAVEQSTSVNKGEKYLSCNDIPRSESVLHKLPMKLLEAPLHTATTKLCLNTQKLLQSKKATACSECGCSTAGYFKFNFAIDYEPTIKQLLYGNKILEEFIVDGVVQSAIQFRDDKIFSCLCCNIEAGWDRSLSTVATHISGVRHKKAKSKKVLQTLRVYHQNWIKMETAQQSHQSHFYPVDTLNAMCRLCSSIVSYESLENHIANDPHKCIMLLLYRKNSHSTLLHLQASVYLPELAGLLSTNFINTVELQQKPKERIATNVVSEKRDESNEKTVPLKGSVAKKSEHKVIISIANPSGNAVSDFLEHRYLKHLGFIQLNPQTGTAKCLCCEVVIRLSPIPLKDHFHSELHIAKCKLPVEKWRYYCDICDFHCARYLTWKKHVVDIKHIERCHQVTSSQKTLICEYECLTCNTILIGDATTVKRHRSGQKRKKKEITLSGEIKQAFKSQAVIQEQCEKLVASANKVVANSEAVDICCKALEEALSEEYPNCRVYPFGSRVSALGNERSDLDVFVDCGDMYFGTKNQDPLSQATIVKNVCRVFRKRMNDFSHINPIPTARTPIVQVYHKASKIDCDLSFRHGLSIENTKFLRFCIHVQPVTQYLILILKKWILYCKLQESINTYALSMLVIYFLQVKNYLLPVQQLKLFNPQNIIVIDGWCIPDFTHLHNDVKNLVAKYDNSVKPLLIDFFDFYKVFNYTENVICPLLGRPVLKSVFLNRNEQGSIPLEMLPYVQKLLNPQAEMFRAKSQLCIQDPFDLSHNLTKACAVGDVNKLIAYCDLTSQYLKSTQ